jgi:hypothetical protein
MTDRIRSLTIVLDRDYRADDVETVMHAIHMIKGVHSVSIGEPVSLKDHINREAVRKELQATLFQAINKAFQGDS